MILRWFCSSSALAWIMTKLDRWLAEPVRLPMALVMTDFFPMPDCRVDQITPEDRIACISPHTARGPAAEVVPRNDSPADRVDGLQRH